MFLYIGVHNHITVLPSRLWIDKGKLYTNFHTPIFMISSDYRLQKFGYNEEWLRNGIETKIPVTAFNSSNTPVPHNSEK